jgi:hypothetical protein
MRRMAESSKLRTYVGKCVQRMLHSIVGDVATASASFSSLPILFSLKSSCFGL